MAVWVCGNELGCHAQIEVLVALGLMVPIEVGSEINIFNKVRWKTDKNPAFKWMHTESP